MDKPICIGASEAARLCGISKTKMYQLMKTEGADFCINLGGRKLIHYDRLSAYLEKMCGGYEQIHGDRTNRK